MKNNANEERLQKNIDKTKRLYNSGLNATEISARLGLSESTVRRYISIIETNKPTE